MYACANSQTTVFKKLKVLSGGAILPHVKHVYAQITKGHLTVLAVAAVGTFGIWFLFLRAPASTEHTMTLQPQSFLQQVSVSGSVVAAQDVDLGFSQGGRVARVYVAVGQQVGTGAVLAEVENADLRASVLSAQAGVETQVARLAALQAGTRPEELAVKQNAVASANRGLIDALQDAYRAADAAVHNTLDQFINNPRTTPSLSFSTTDSNIKTAVETKRLLAEGLLSVWGSEVVGLGATADLSGAAAHGQQNLAAITSLLSDANTVLNRVILTTGTTQATIDSYVAAVATARTAVNSGVSAVNNALATLLDAQKNLSLAQAGSAPEDIAAQQAQLKQAQAAVALAQAQLQKTLIIAPFGGMVTVVDAKAGKIVSPNTPELSLISNGAFQIESYVPEINIALIHVGDHASVTLDAYGASVPFEAKVVLIDPAQTVRDGVSTYRITLAFAIADPRIKSGMTANVLITTAKKEAVLAVPQGAVIIHGATYTVRVKTVGGIVERSVTVGGTDSLGNFEILSGLSVGEVVVLGDK